MASSMLVSVDCMRRSYGAGVLVGESGMEKLVGLGVVVVVVVVSKMIPVPVKVVSTLNPGSEE